MSVTGAHKRRSRSSFVSVRYIPTDEEEEIHRQTEAQNLRVSLHQIKNIEPILNLVENFNRHLHLTLMVDRFHSSYQEYYLALSQALRDILAKNWIRTQQFYQMAGGKRVYYLSLEFYIGRYMRNTLINLDINEQMTQAAEALNIKLNDIEELEDDAALGNGGLGRLAACFLDSMATLGISSYGYGLRYQFGIFKQQIVDGWQVEVPDDWLRQPMPWEVRRVQNEIRIHFYGKVIWNESTNSFQWTDYETVIAQAYDYPVPGYKNNIVNTMRLFSAKADCDFNFKSFNEGEYIHAVMERNKAERITCVLYPNDNIAEGRELRLKQEYFLIAASLHDILRRFKGEKRWQASSNKETKNNTLQLPGAKSNQISVSSVSVDFKCMPDMVAIQLNDTHPSLAIPEMMRLLLDNEHLSWDDAWYITVNCFAYTNHTLMPEAIERWPVQMIERPALIRGLAEIVERRPNDPIEYLATYLYKQVQNTRTQKRREDESKQLELERQQAEDEKLHRAQLKNEIRALREQEENERKQREAEEKRKRDAEELAKRHKELAAAPPPLPAVREEDDVFVVEFGETELHRRAAVQNANLSELLRDNYHSIASRNAEGKTPRDVALDAGLQENVDQIDNFCVLLLQNGNTKAVNDLLLCGYTEIINQLKTIEDSDEDTNDFINNEIPQLLAKIKQLNQAIKDGDIETVDTMTSDRKNIALYRDSEGSSSLHDAIENHQYNIALHLLQKYPSLALVKDIRDRTSLDLLNSIDEDTITDEQREIYDQLKEALISTSASQQND